MLCRINYRQERSTEKSLDGFRKLIWYKNWYKTVLTVSGFVPITVLH